MSEYGLFGVRGGTWGIILGGQGWVGVYGGLFWVSRIELGFVGKYFGWVGLSGIDLRRVHCLIMPDGNTYQ